MKKLTTIFLLAALLLPATSSCSTPTGDIQTQSKESTTETTAVIEDPLADNLPERDYDGKTFTIWGDVYEYVYFYDNNQTGDVIDDAVYNRNRAIEERFNIKFQYDLYEAWWREMADMRSSVLASTGAYDILTGVTPHMSTNLLSGLYQNLADMEYIDLSKPWWFSYVNDEAIIGDRLYMASGYFDMPSLSRTLVTFYSTELAEQYDVEDLYTLVHEGKWTFDKMISIAKNVNVDLNGDGKMTEVDLYGLTAQHDTISPLFATSYSFIQRETDGSMQITPATEAMTDVNTLFYEILYNSEWYYDGYRFNGAHNYEKMENVFTNNQALFFINYLSYASKGSLREMGTYGLLPTPKLQESQKDYCSFSSAFVSAIPIDAPDTEYSSIILEALQAESYKKVLPAYYDTALSRKFLNDEESVEILDIITANVRCDFTYIYSLAGVWGYDLAVSVGLRKNYISWYEAKNQAYNECLQDMIEIVSEFEQ